MTPNRWVYTAATSATLGLVCVAVLPLAGYTTTAGLWLTYAMVASGITTVATTFAAIAALTPLQPLTGPWEPTEPLPPVVTARVIRPALERPVLALPAGEPT